jgi:hypothetical protein
VVFVGKDGGRTQHGERSEVLLVLCPWAVATQERGAAAFMTCTTRKKECGGVLRVGRRRRFEYVFIK